jgi:hypothetical protein
VAFVKLVTDLQKTEICMDVADQVNLNQYFLQHCSAFTREQKISKFSAQHTMASNHIYHVIIGTMGTDVYGALFLNSTIIAADFTEVFFPLATTAVQIS